MTDLFGKLAIEIFVADGGVDDFEKMPDGELRQIVSKYLEDASKREQFLQFVVEEARKLG